MFTAGGSCPGRGPQNHAPSWVLRVLWFPPPVGARSGGRPLFFPSRSAPCGRLGAVFFVLFWALRPSLLGRFPAALPPPLAPRFFLFGARFGPLSRGLRPLGPALVLLGPLRAFGPALGFLFFPLPSWFSAFSFIPAFFFWPPSPVLSSAFFFAVYSSLCCPLLFWGPACRLVSLFFIIIFLFYFDLQSWFYREGRGEGEAIFSRPERNAPAPWGKHYFNTLFGLKRRDAPK